MKQVNHKASFKNLSTGSLNYFSSEFSFKSLYFLFCNSFYKFLWSFYAFTDEALFCIFSFFLQHSHLVKPLLYLQRCSFLFSMLYNLSLLVWLNGFIISDRRSITLCNSVLYFSITPCRRYCDTFPFFFWSMTI